MDPNSNTEMNVNMLFAQENILFVQPNTPNVNNVNNDNPPAIVRDTTTTARLEENVNANLVCNLNAVFFEQISCFN
jgi:hypothetical protein